MPSSPHDQIPRSLLTSLPVAVCLLRGDDLTVEWVNDAYQAFAPGKRMIGLTWDELWRETGQDFTGICRRVLETGASHQAADEANRIRRAPDADTETAWFSWSLHRVRLPGRDRYDLVGTAFETTSRMRAVLEAQAREQWYRLLFDRHPEAMWVFDQETLRFLEVNEAAVARYGWTREEFLAMTIKDIRPAEDVPRIIARTQSRTDGIRDAGFWRHHTKHGLLLDVHVTSHAIDFAGRQGVIVVAADVTARRQAEAALLESEEVNRVTFLHAAVGIAHVAPDGRFLRCNQQLADIVGYTVPELLARRFQEITHPDDLSQDLALVQKLVDGDLPAYTIAKRYLRKDGSIAQVTLTVSLVRNLDGSPRFFISIIQDDSERHRAESEQARLRDQLAQAQKLESIGRLAGGVAHDYNNMLSVILGYTDLAMQEVPPDGSVASSLREVQAAAEQSVELTAQLLAFARRQAATPRTIDLNVTVEGMLKMLRRLIGEDIALDWEPGAAPWPVRMDPAQVHQLLANLCVNARDAIASTGRIALRTRNVTVDAVRAATTPDLRAGDYVELRVTDDGSGMTPAVAAHIFEPFFTTKPTGKGTGLGLAMVFGIVRQNGGAIDVRTAPGAGTTFTMLIPREAAHEATSHGTTPPEGTPRGHETVLLVEDEPAVLRIAAETLRRLGYTVLTAATPQQAHQALDAADPPPALLITDVILPEQSGPDLAAALRARLPSLKVLFVSGYPGSILEDRGLVDHTALLPKPFGTSELAVRIRSLLDA